MCINKPITIPTGTDGKNCYIAFASNSTGANFSYTQTSANLQYISFVCKTGSISSSDFTTWTKFVGNDGIDGDDGISIVDVFISDGVTPIGGTVYGLNHVICQLSNGSYVDAGAFTPCCELTWTEFTLINGWTTSTKDPASYSIKNGFLYTRGILQASGASAATFTNLTMGFTNSVAAVISDTDITTPVFSEIEFLNTNTITITEYSNGNGAWILDSVPAINIR